MIKAVIFDFDGLMIDTESLWFDVFYKFAKQDFHIELNKRDFAYAVGTSANPYYELIENEVGQSINRVEFSEKAKIEFEKRVSTIQLREGVLEYLKYAKANGYKIGLATSSTFNWVERFLKQFGLLQYFDVIMTSDIVGTKKPDPKVYLETLKALSIIGEEAIAFEDSINGYKAATDAGINTVVVPNGLTKYIEFPVKSFCISSMKEMELKDIIKMY